MINIVSKTQRSINNIIFHANRYADGLIRAEGKKTCTELAKTIGICHDKIQRDLDKTSAHLDEIRSLLVSNVISEHKKGFLITDSTLLIKEHARKIEGVSYQYDGSKGLIVPGIGLSAIVWTDFKKRFLLIYSHGKKEIDLKLQLRLIELLLLLKKSMPLVF